MMAKLVDRLPVGKEWAYEAKFDGYRVLVVKEKTVSVLSWNNNCSYRTVPNHRRRLH
jgi:ATP-dependent DNA ligase